MSTRRSNYARYWVLAPLALAALGACSGSSCVNRPAQHKVSVRASQLPPTPSAQPADLPPRTDDDNPLEMPAVGTARLRILTPTVLELMLVTTQAKAQPLERWDFVRDRKLQLPPADQISVSVDSRPIAVSRMGFKRRVLYAPLGRRDLRVGNYLYLELASPVPPGAHVDVKNPTESLFTREMRFEATAAPLRLSPAIHVNQVGYMPASPKRAKVGYYLGSLGELPIGTQSFAVIESKSGKQVFQGTLRPRRESGQPYKVKPYQQVFDADFSAFDRPGEYLLSVPGLGASYRFFVHDGVHATLARTYALGLYHQRCGDKVSLPYTRHVHDSCHTAQAEVPSPQLPNLQKTLSSITKEFAKNRRHSAPQLKDVAASLYPFVRTGKIDTTGGHHDAGDYGKYTFNSAMLVHQLAFAADALEGVGELDNLGIPESGDGIGDVLQMARREAEFLVKMQDDDGGFYFLVRPRDRSYENNVLPDKSDVQAVWPKNTVVSAAAVAALAQAGSSPRMKKSFASDADRFLQAAKKGWAFLQNAQGRFGRDGAYQRIGHYGDEFMHDDELAWAATEMYLATGDKDIHKKLLESFNPDDPGTVRWTWQRMFESYGAAIRSYAFAAASGRQAAGSLDPGHLARCRNQVRERAKDLVKWAEGNAYGVSFPEASKRFRTAGWYFPVADTFDLVAAQQLDPKPEILQAIASNLDFELGANPNNIAFLTGVGARRQREIVHQYADNDRRVLPPSGIPLGAVQSGFPWLPGYDNELRDLTFPSDGDQDDPFPFYDRWGDTRNVTTEFTVDTLGRGIAASAWLMARSAFKGQGWKVPDARIEVLAGKAEGRGLSARLQVEGMDVADAQVVWEAAGQEPRFGTPDVTFPDGAGSTWIEAEALWPDGRRVAAALQL
jgi:hypothetical protein